MSRVAVVAVLYFVLALLASSLAELAGGGRAPIWPAAGLAVGALVAWGWRCWPGVWLGAAAYGLWLDVGIGTVVLAAFGPALQAILGALLARRFFAVPEPLARDGDVLRFLLYSGPLACLVSASLATAVLFAIGRLPAAGVAVHWLAWWSGDVLGVLLFAPVAVLA